MSLGVPADRRAAQALEYTQLYFIRLKVNTLDPDKKYVVCCDTGRRSSAGAYILSERGFQAYVLRDGIKDQN